MPPRSKAPADPDTFDGPADEDPAIADPDATGPTPKPNWEPAEPMVLDDDDEDDGEQPTYDPDGEYVVTTDALVVKSGPETNDTVRVTRGQVIQFKSEHAKPRIGALLKAKAIAPNDGDTKVRTTAKAAAAAQGADGDPVPVPNAMEVADTTVVPSGDPTVVDDGDPSKTA